jgi:hypothetical protein
MIGRRWWALCAILLTGCFNDSSVMPFVTGFSGQGSQNQFYAVGTGAPVATVGGKNFTASTTVFWNQKPLKTTFQSETALQIAFLNGETDLAQKGVVLTAVNDDGLTSPPFEVAVVDALLTLDSIAPQVVPAGSPDTKITLTGQGFRPTSQVKLDGRALQTTFVSATSLTAIAPASALVTATQLGAQVVEPACSPSGSFVPCNVSSSRVLLSVGTPASDFRVMLMTTGGGVLDLASADGMGLLLVSTSAATINAVDPVAGQITATLNTGGSFPHLSVSDGDQFLYAWGNPGPVRYTLPGLSAPVTFPGMDSNAVIVPAPGAPATFAFSGFFGAGIIDDTTARPNQTATLSSFASVFWGADATSLYGVTYAVGGLRLIGVDANGLVMPGTTVSTARFDNLGRLVFGRASGRIFSDEGATFDANGGSERDFGVMTLPTSLNDCALALDEGLGKAFFACPETPYGLTVRSYDLQTMQMIGRIVIPTNNFNVQTGRVVRWGNNGLAVGAGNGLYLYSGPFVR